METVVADHDDPIKEIFPELTRDVIDRMKHAENQRLREVLTLVVRHVHAIVREAEITHGLPRSRSPRGRRSRHCGDSVPGNQLGYPTLKHLPFVTTAGTFPIVGLTGLAKRDTGRNE
jgi:hypothetical protein